MSQTAHKLFDKNIFNCVEVFKSIAQNKFKNVVPLPLFFSIMYTLPKQILH